jgi:hypothetical protein
MNLEISTEAAQFPEKEYLNGIFLAVQCNPAVWKANTAVLLQGMLDCVDGLETSLHIVSKFGNSIETII